MTLDEALAAFGPNWSAPVTPNAMMAADAGLSPMLDSATGGLLPRSISQPAPWGALAAPNPMLGTAPLILAQATSSSAPPRAQPAPQQPVPSVLPQPTPPQSDTVRLPFAGGTITTPALMAPLAGLTPTAPPQGGGGLFGSVIANLTPQQRVAAMLYAIKGDYSKLAEMLTGATLREQEAEAQALGKARGSSLGQQAAARTAAPNIAGGLDELAALPERYGGNWGTFGSSIGPVRGDPNHTWLDPRLLLSHAWESAWTSMPWVAGPPGSSPSEVRRAIEGATNTLATILKPLIRQPGEGMFSDKDQAMLNSIIGNLTQAWDEPSYRRELENVRQRIMANFGIQLPEITAPRQQAQQAQIPQLQPGESLTRPNGVRVRKIR
jgi:hypothetical protein